MKQASFWPVSVTCTDHVAAGTMVWRRAGNLWLTVFAKATFSFDDGARLVPVAPQPIARHDVHAAGDRSRSSLTPSDVVPFRNAADVVFVGCAHARGTRPVRHARVGLAIERDGRRLIDKRLHVIGDRRVEPGGTPPAPEPFLFMPLIYERAYGGPASSRNPVGVGERPGADGKVTLPNIVYPSPDRREEPAGLGPLASAWPVRSERAGSLGSSLDRAVIDLPDNFDDAYFQCAPQDQQLGIVDADDVLFLDGIHKQHRHMTLPLPPFEVCLEAHLGRTELDLTPRIDLVHIDGEARQCTLSWRGFVQLEQEADVHRVAVAAALRPRQAARVLPRPVPGTLTGEFQFIRMAPLSKPLAERADAEAKAAPPPPPRHRKGKPASGPPPPPKHRRPDISDLVTVPRELAPEAENPIQGIHIALAPIVIGDGGTLRVSPSPEEVVETEEERGMDAGATVRMDRPSSLRAAGRDEAGEPEG